MVLLDTMWDDVLAGPQPERGLGMLRKVSTKFQGFCLISPHHQLLLAYRRTPFVKFACVDTHADGESSAGKYQRSMSMPPQSPTTPTTPVSPMANSASPRHSSSNVWRSVFNPGSNLATKSFGADIFDKPKQPNSPTVYDWFHIISYHLTIFCLRHE
ncbi:auxin-repressed 12.5 kDa protein [Canna indica]|uniref:Auxin-repressed 12.5 kDa protein n=1 Tax=Canna indica TaxID=4628 RepID=A0AAQ3KF34_9LILI|nr:auxin-repressed 12.5 kDa protein [Canna indica]